MVSVSGECEWLIAVVGVSGECDVVSVSGEFEW